MAIENIILDIGNVICRWDSDRLIRGVFTDDAEVEQAHSATVGHPDWLELDRGTITLASAIANAQDRTGLDAEKIAQIYHNTAASLTPIDSTVKLIREMSQDGVPLYVLSNMHDHCWQYLSTNYDFWSCFQGVVVSCNINLIKPDPAIYSHVLQTFQLDPSVTAFVDDMPVNIDAANAAGIQGTVLEHPDHGEQVIRGLIG